MSERRWFNPNVPQTLLIGQILLYFDAFWMVIGVMVGGGLGVLGLLALAAYLYGAYGIANEKKLGYQVAVLASFLPLALRLAVFLFGSADTSIGWVLFTNNPINVIFEYALIALLLHPMSRDYQKIWFS